MAKNKKNSEVDDLLDGPEVGTETLTEGAEASTGTELTDEVKENGENADKAQLEALIKAKADELKKLKAELKGEKPKKERTLKGQMVAFKNKAGDVITGLGQMYYVARHGGKLHYKEASQVILLPEDWKDGDPIPWPVAEAAEATKSEAEQPQA